MDNFWKDKSAGIDYQGFLRIFSKYQIQIDREAKVSSAPKVISDDTVRLKKKIYTTIQQALDKTGRTINELFKKIDFDKSNTIQSAELHQMFKDMQQQVTLKQSAEIFDSIDFDGSGAIAMPEFMADFKMVCCTDIDELIREEHTKRNENLKIAQGGAGHLSKQQYEGV